MKLIIAGSRTGNINHILEKLEQLPIIKQATEIVSGGCPTGADKAGEIYAQQYGVIITVFNADWNAHGKAAGPIRNSMMAKYADSLVCFWDGKSRGTANIIKCMNDLKKPVQIIYEVKGDK